jgi:coenzyme PQQ synthesis protein D (PqqD)
LQTNRQMRALSLQSTVVAAGDVVGCALDGEAILLNVRTGTYYGLDAVGHRMWQLVQQPRMVASVRDAIVDEFEVGVDRCERELLSLLIELERHQLIAVTDADPR